MLLQRKRCPTPTLRHDEGLKEDVYFTTEAEARAFAAMLTSQPIEYLSEPIDALFPLRLHGLTHVRFGRT